MLRDVCKWSRNVVFCPPDVRCSCGVAARTGATPKSESEEGGEMAKTQAPFAVASGGGLFRKLVTAVFGLAVLWLVVKFPADAASWVTHVGHVAVMVIDSVGTFLRHVAG